MQKIYAEERIPLVMAAIAEQPWCQLQFPGCWGRATALDEIKSRARGGSITDRANCVPTCGPCNTYKEDHPLEALARGLARHAWDNDTPPPGGTVNDPTNAVPAIALLGADLIVVDPDSGDAVEWTVCGCHEEHGAKKERMVIVDYTTADGVEGRHEFEANEQVTVRSRTSWEAA